MKKKMPSKPTENLNKALDHIERFCDLDDKTISIDIEARIQVRNWLHSWVGGNLRELKKWNDNKKA